MPLANFFRFYLISERREWKEEQGGKREWDSAQDVIEGLSF